MDYHQRMEEMVNARAALILPHLPDPMPEFCQGCGKKVKYASYIDARRMWAYHLAEETFTP